MEINIKNKGSLAIFALLIIGFLSWTIFSTSFLLSEETSVLHDKYRINKFENQRNILENIFYIYVRDIENEINSNFSDIIEYISTKDGEFIFLNNYSDEPKSDSGFKIIKMLITDFENNKITFDFLNGTKHYRYLNLLKNEVHRFGTTGFITFQKEIKDISIEGCKEKYIIFIQGDIIIKYCNKNTLSKDKLNFCQLKELRFKIDDV